MSTSKQRDYKSTSAAVALVTLLAGTAAISGSAAASPLPSVSAGGATNAIHSGVQPVRYDRWGGGGIYIAPSYGYYSTYDYDDDDDDYDYYPSRSYSYDGDYRPYRTHNRRWARERFEHPLGRR